MERDHKTGGGETGFLGQEQQERGKRGREREGETHRQREGETEREKGGWKVGRALLQRNTVNRHRWCF